MVKLKPMQASYPLKRLRTSERDGRGVVRHPFDPHLTLPRAPYPLVEGGGEDARSMTDEEKSGQCMPMHALHRLRTTVPK